MKQAKVTHLRTTADGKMTSCYRDTAYEDDLLQVLAERSDKALPLETLAMLIHADRRIVKTLLSKLIAEGKVVKENQSSKNRFVSRYRLLNSLT